MDGDLHIEETIAAISTAVGRAAIGIVRMSGPEAMSIANACFRTPSGKTLAGDSHVMSYGYVIDPVDGSAVDEVLVAVMRAPRTYTCEDIVEFNCHGGPAAQRAILRLLLRLGARVAEPGEFTRRAFLNGRIDLTQVESVAGIVSARSSGALRASMRQLEGGLSGRLKEIRHTLIERLAMLEATVDFTDEEVDEVDRNGVLAGLGSARAELDRLSGTAFLGKALEQGVQTAIVGRPNVGKSSLLNALVMRERAIVSEIAGTTRDTVEESMEIGGIPIRLVDTAGMRSGGGRVEQLGVERSVKVMEQADLVLAVFDVSRPWSASDQRLAKRLIPGRSIIVGSKSDLTPEVTLSSLLERVARATKCEDWRGCLVSATRGDGLGQLRELITSGIGGESGIHLEEPVLATERQRELVERAMVGVDSAIAAVVRQADEELVCEDIRLAIGALGQITGEDLTVDLLDEIFSRFCIGK